MLHVCNTCCFRIECVYSTIHTPPQDNAFDSVFIKKQILIQRSAIRRQMVSGHGESRAPVPTGSRLPGAVAGRRHPVGPESNKATNRSRTAVRREPGCSGHTAGPAWVPTRHDPRYTGRAASPARPRRRRRCRSTRLINDLRGKTTSFQSAGRRAMRGLDMIGTIEWLRPRQPTIEQPSNFNGSQAFPKWTTRQIAGRLTDTQSR